MNFFEKTIQNLEQIKEELGIFFAAFDFYKLNLMEEKIRTLFLENSFDIMFDKETFYTFSYAYNKIKEISKALENWKHLEEKKQIQDYFESISPLILSFFSYLEENEKEFQNFKIYFGKPRMYDLKNIDYHRISSYSDYQDLTLTCFDEKTSFEAYKARIETFAYYLNEAKSWQRNEEKKKR